MTIEQFLMELNKKGYLDLENTKEITLFSEVIKIIEK